MNVFVSTASVKGSRDVSLIYTVDRCSPPPPVWLYRDKDRDREFQWLLSLLHPPSSDPETDGCPPSDVSQRTDDWSADLKQQQEGLNKELQSKTVLIISPGIWSRLTLPAKEYLQKLNPAFIWTNWWWVCWCCVSVFHRPGTKVKGQRSQSLCCSYFDTEEDGCSTIHQTDSPPDNDPETLRPQTEQQRKTTGEKTAESVPEPQTCGQQR